MYFAFAFHEEPYNTGMRFVYAMQELSTTIRAVAEYCIETISGLQALPDVSKEVAFEDQLQTNEVCICLQSTIPQIWQNYSTHI